MIPKLKTLQGLLLRRRLPLFVTLRITNRCNIRCTYCDSHNFAGAEMDTVQIFSMIDELSSQGMIKLGLTGGEPLLRPDIGQIIEYAWQRGVVVTLNSNGLLVPRKLSELQKLHTLFISLDGLEDSQEKLRGKGSFRYAFKAIEAARAAGLKVWTLTVITKENVAEIEDLIRLLAPLGVKMLFQPVELWDIHSSLADDLKPPEGAYQEVIERLIAWKKKYRVIGASLSYLQLLKHWPHYPRDVRCYVGRFSCNILPDGKVIGCTVAPPAHPDNGLETGFYQAFLKLQTPKCRGCFMNCYHEPNFLVKLNPEALLNAARFRF